MTNLSNNSDEDDYGPLVGNEDLDLVIFTSDDEHGRDQLQTQSSHDTLTRGGDDPGDVDNQTAIYSIAGDPPTKKPKLTEALSLVSYTIDEDEEEESQIPSDSYEEVEVENASDDFKKDITIANFIYDANLAGGRSGQANQVYNISQSSVGKIHSKNTPELATVGLDNEKPTNEPPFLPSLKFESYQLMSQDQTELNQSDNAIHEDFSSSVKFTAYTYDSYVLDAALKDEDAPPTETLTERLIREVTLPPEPTGLCRMELQEKVDREVRRMRLDISYDPNRAIQDNKAFRNPSIYEKLIAFLNIDEKGTNFPSMVYNPYRWSPQSYYDELARVQNREIDRITKLQKEQQQQKQKKPDPITQTATTVGSGNSVLTGYTEPKKRSKWDAASVSAKGSEADGTADATATKQQASTEEPNRGTVPPVGSLIRRR